MTALHWLQSAMTATWGTPGTSEFLAAALGGGMTLLAQRWSLNHDKNKEALRRKDEQKAVAWGAFFKINHVYNILSDFHDGLTAARARSAEKGENLWQVYQAPVHDYTVYDWTTQELTLLIEHEKFELMNDYQQALIWASNIVQSGKLYRGMRVEFLTNIASEMKGDEGAFELNPQTAPIVMPKIAHLHTLVDSMEKVVAKQVEEVRSLVESFADAMRDMVGGRPELAPTQNA